MGEFFGAILLALGLIVVLSIVTRSMSRAAETRRVQRLSGFERERRDRS